MAVDGQTDGQRGSLLPQKLSHPRLPAATLVQSDSSILGAASCESGALATGGVDEFLLGHGQSLTTETMHSR